MRRKNAIHPSAWERNLARSSSSQAGRAKKPSHIVLSEASPIDPVEGLSPASFQWLPKAGQVYCDLKLNDEGALGIAGS